MEEDGVQDSNAARKLVLLALCTCLALCNQRAPEHAACRGGALPPRRADVSEVAVEVNYHHMQPSVLVVFGVQQNASLAIVNIFGPTLEDGAYYRLQRWASAAPVEVHYYHACLSACLLTLSGRHLCSNCFLLKLCCAYFLKLFFSLRGSSSGEV